MIPVTILIPIGPQKEYLEWLPEALESVINQTYPVDEILLIGDGTEIDIMELPFYRIFWSKEDNKYGKEYYDVSRWGHEDEHVNISYWQSPWNIGFAQAFNCGIGLADNELIIYLAADDKLMPEAVADCVKTWEDNHEKDAWYALTYQLQNGEVHTIPINAAMITRNLWKWANGFPPSAFAGPDALFLSRLMIHAPDRIIKVAEGKPNYWIRQHANQETGRQASFFLTEMDSIRNKETERFVPNTEVVLK